MKKLIQAISPILLVAYLLISHFEVPMHDFGKGMLLGLSVVGSIYTLVNVKYKSRKTV